MCGIAADEFPSDRLIVAALSCVVLKTVKVKPTGAATCHTEGVNEVSPPAGALAEAGTQMVPFACSHSSSDPYW